MFHNKFLTLALLLSACSALCAAQLDMNLNQAVIPKPTDGSAAAVIPAVQEDPEKRKTTTTTVVPETTSTTTTTSTSTTTTTTTTTPKPTTSSTTTTTTTTPAPTTSTTTPAPTTVAPKTTTPAPAPLPEPQVGHWNSSCIMIQLAAQLNFSYVTKDNKTAYALYNIPANAIVEDSHCASNTSQTIQINWGPAEAQHSMLLQFDRVNKSSELVMLYFVLPLTSDNFPNARENQTIQLVHRGDEFVTPVEMSYHCTRAQTFNLTEVLMDKNVTGTVRLTNVQSEAFMTDKKKEFSTALDCDGSKTLDIVPIAVGIAMAALIAIVLISYLCARRRSTSRGYMSF